MSLPETVEPGPDYERTIAGFSCIYCLPSSDLIQLARSLQKLYVHVGRPEMAIRVLIVDDQSLIRRGTEALLQATPGIAVVGVVGSGQEAVDQASRMRPDVVLIEVSLSAGDGLGTIRSITSRCPQANILVVTRQDDPEQALRAIEAGAVGYVLKDISAANLVQAIKHVASGRAMLNPRLARYMIGRLAARNGNALQELRSKGLTSREIEILLTLARGMSDREIATHHFLAEATIKSHLKAIYRKLGVRNRAQAAAFAASRGLLDVH